MLDIPNSNTRLDKFIEGLEATVIDLPKLCQEWNTIDDELCFNYQQSLQWMLEQIPIALAALPDGSHWHTRLYLANQKLESIRPIWEFIVR